MSTEVSIAKPISGPEALESCIDSLRKSLAKDDRFGSHMAYSGFKAIITFKLFPQLSFVPDVDKTVFAQEGEQSDIAESPTVDAMVEIPVRPPNKVREEAGLPQPVLVTDGQGRSTEKWVKASNKAPAQPTRQTNKVIGG